MLISVWQYVLKEDIHEADRRVDPQMETCLNYGFLDRLVVVKFREKVCLLGSERAFPLTCDALSGTNSPWYTRSG